MNRIKSELFVFACWLAAKAIRMRARQMLKEGIFVNTNLPLEGYCKEVFESDFGEVVYEFMNK